MSKSKSEEKNSIKLSFLIFGIIMILFSIINLFAKTITNNFTSIWDYEGFEIGNMILLFFGIAMLLFSMYLFYQKRDYQNKKVKYLGVVFFLPLLVHTSFNDLKYHLPLKEIETTQIEGTIAGSNISIISLSKHVNNNQELPGIYIDELAEFPNITFGYANRQFRDKIVNIPNTNPEKVAERNKRQQGKFETLKIAELPVGTKIKLRVRTNELGALNEFMKSGEHLIELRKGEYDQRRSIKFYELSIDDKIIFQKFGLKN